jgi:hypothetical protein
MSYIKFPFDKKKIKTELEAHLEDKTDFYMQNGYDLETSEKMAIADMGDSKEIGKALNKQHNPAIGWIWKISNVITIIALVLSLYYSVLPLVVSFFKSNDYPESGIPHENIVYKLNIKKSVQLDDTVINFTNVIYEKNGNLSIVYNYHDKKMHGRGWSFGGIGEVSDNIGKVYFSGSGYSRRRTNVRTFKDFNKDATSLIITYNYFNRYYRVEIPLKKDEIDEKN